MEPGSLARFAASFSPSASPTWPACLRDSTRDLPVPSVEENRPHIHVYPQSKTVYENHDIWFLLDELDCFIQLSYPGMNCLDNCSFEVVRTLGAVFAPDSVLFLDKILGEVDSKLHGPEFGL